MTAKTVLYQRHDHFTCGSPVLIAAIARCEGYVQGALDGRAAAFPIAHEFLGAGPKVW